ncbi:hypothetical protein C1X72_20145 [Pseudomonas sp. FW306-2-2C-D06B]|nr:hypothetical protein C1X72_20145 [Pseudomonas sp. FW306-2-2C-D06B]PNB54660.1 hypothetical protein C1X73_25650 [Pseudomonas sp. FW305-130]
MRQRPHGRVAAKGRDYNANMRATRQPVLASSPASQLPQEHRCPQGRCSTCRSWLAGDEASTGRQYYSAMSQSMR